MATALIISHGDSSDDRVWHLLRGNFDDVAEEVRAQYPDRIEEKRSSEVVVALPLQGGLSSGMLCACLPTEESTGFAVPYQRGFLP